MGLEIESGSVAVLGILLTSTVSAFAITRFESFLAKQEEKVSATSQVSQIYQGRSSIEQDRYVSFVPKVYAIKREEELFFQSWRDSKSEYIPFR